MADLVLVTLFHLTLDRYLNKDRQNMVSKTHFEQGLIMLKSKTRLSYQR